MRAALALALALAGCAPDAMPPAAPTCPASVAVPAGLPRVRSVDALGQYAIRLELAREAERSRGDCWRDAAGGVDGQ